ncbi:MAG: lysine biosynthesis protein LysW [Candidatus Lokiarchaeota archaeon]|nr:lysine biosynthesis protein LysW [Candidatus Lokiarchaeota archaeon]
MVKCECPSCFFEFELDDGTIEGEVIPCPDCVVDLEIVKIEGDVATAQVAEMSEEDWGE